jgi:hypothetical protein
MVRAHQCGSPHDGDVAGALEGQVGSVVVLEDAKGEAESWRICQLSLLIYWFLERGAWTKGEVKVKEKNQKRKREEKEENNRE